jgi:acyl transferase domain-containing protein
MDLEAALRVVAQRGQLMGEMPRGAMLSIRSAAEEIGPLLGSDVVIAAVNAPRLCVASGPAGAVAALQERLTARDIPHRPLRTSHAFHSPMMDPAVPRFEAVLRDVRLNPPSIPFVACPAGRLITPDEARSPAYWARQLRDPVRFVDGLRALAGPGTIFLEVGPRATLTALVRQTLPGRVRAVSAMEQEDGDADGAAALLAAFGRLWCWGVDGLDWDAADPVPHWQRVSLPTYPFERKRHWIEPGVPRSAAPAGAVLGDGNGSGWSTAVAQQRALIRNQQNLLERLRQGREPAPAATGRPIGGT